MSSKILKVIKRNGTIVNFDSTKIEEAIMKAANSVGGHDREMASELTKEVIKYLETKFNMKNIPTVENVQDFVEKVLIDNGHAKTAKSYILYRNERAKLRELQSQVPIEVRNIVNENKKYFRNFLAEFVYYRTYSKWMKENKRRETWIETVDRFINYMKECLKDKMKEKEYDEIRNAILYQKAMPSMRLFQFAGDATKRTNVCAYNCSFIAPSRFSDFGEIIYILMCGTGVGYSVEYQNVEALPQIKRQIGKTLPLYIIPDSKEGWADAMIFGMKTWYSGYDVEFDYSQIRPAGSRLKTMGGRASGPGPLRDLLDFSRKIILSRQGRRLKPIDVNDIICKIGESVVAGGVRRTALISLSDLDDVEMRDSKAGTFYVNNYQRSMANNSAVYNDKPTVEQFMEEWVALMKSGTGERGIFNRGSFKKHLPERRRKFLKDKINILGVNPCGEIILQNRQFCNLSEIVARAEDTEKTLLEKTRIAAILGTFQSTLTNFPYLSKEWEKNCDDERLLGVSINGQWDSKAVRNPSTLEKMRDLVIEVNKKYAKRFGIKVSNATTCVKPSGNTSQTFDCASGLHPRYAKYYLRRVRISATDPLFKMLKAQKVTYYPEVGQREENASTFVFEFPIAAPKGAITRNDISAIEQLEYWKMLKTKYTEHNPSVTVYVAEDEWLEVGNWVYKYWDIVCGISFLPKSNHLYELAPYQEISKEEYEKISLNFPKIDFSDLVLYEKDDETESKSELACSSGACEL